MGVGALAVDLSRWDKRFPFRCRRGSEKLHLLFIYYNCYKAPKKEEEEKTDNFLRSVKGGQLKECQQNMEFHMFWICRTDRREREIVGSERDRQTDRI